MKIEEAREQGLGSRQLAPALDVCQRGVLKLAQGHPLAPQTREPRQQRRLRPRADSQRHGVDAKPHDRFRPFDSGMAAGANHAEQHVFLPTVAAQEQSPRAQYHRVQRHLVRFGHRLEGARRRFRQSDLLLAADLKAIHLVAGASAKDERRRRAKTLERPTPETFSPGSLLAPQPSDKIAVGGRRREFQFLAATAGLVKREDFIQQEYHGPAVNQ